jgi:hypothetical protein
VDDLRGGILPRIALERFARELARRRAREDARRRPEGAEDESRVRRAQLGGEPLLRTEGSPAQAAQRGAWAVRAQARAEPRGAAALGEPARGRGLGDLVERRSG